MLKSYLMKECQNK